jgi:hypothetical protein
VCRLDYSPVALFELLTFFVVMVIIGGAVAHLDAGRADYVAHVPAFDPMIHFVLGGREENEISQVF